MCAGLSPQLCLPSLTAGVGNVPLGRPGRTRSRSPSGFLTRWARPGPAEQPRPSHASPEFNCNKRAQPALDHAARLTARSGPGLIEPGSPGNRFKGIQAVNHLQAPSQNGLANKEPPEPLQTRPRSASRWRGADVPGVARRGRAPALRPPGLPRGRPAQGRPRGSPDRPLSTADLRSRGWAPRLGPGTAA